MTEATIQSATILGLEAVPVTVHAQITPGLPGIHIVGMADAAATDIIAKMRLTLRETGYELPRGTITIDLSPHDVYKSPTALTLPLVLSVLLASKQIPESDLTNALVVGDLGLTGYVLPVRGGVAYERLARAMALDYVSAPVTYNYERNPRGMGLASLSDARTSSLVDIQNARKNQHGLAEISDAQVPPSGLMKYAAIIAATSNLNMAILPSPGTRDESLIWARIVRQILGPAKPWERADYARTYSICGMNVPNGRPFRAPHFSISNAGLVGGGRPIMPGEVTLANGGVLYLDNAEMVSSSAFAYLRQPAETGLVSITRAREFYQFPADFVLVIAIYDVNLARHINGLPAAAQPGSSWTARDCITKDMAPLVDMVLTTGDAHAKNAYAAWADLTLSEMTDAVAAAKDFQAHHPEGIPYADEEVLLTSQRHAKAATEISPCPTSYQRELGSITRLSSTIAAVNSHDAITSSDVLDAVELAGWLELDRYHEFYDAAVNHDDQSDFVR